MGTSLGRIERRTHRPRRAHRPTASVSLPIGENEDGQHECPVCMTSMDGTNVFDFPCGHCVCNECDGKLQRRGFHSCPTCREPRVGYSREEVDEAANARVHRDRLNEQVANGQEPMSTTTLEHHGSHYHVIFIHDESSIARPYDVLRTVHADGTIEGAGNDASAGRHSQGTNAPNTPDEANASGHNNLVSVTGPLAEMLQGLIEPTSMGSFLQRHDALSTLLTARNARPRYEP